MEPREALARALRLNRYGGMRPLWEDAPMATKVAWLDQADFVLLHLGKSGFTVARADARKDRET